MNLPEFFGLDIGAHSIKIAQVKRKSESKARLVSLGSASTPFGVVGSDNKEHKKQLADDIKKLLDSTGIGTKKTVVALPESTIFTRLMVLPKLDEKELKESIHWEAKQYIPVPLEKVQLEDMVVGERKENGQTKLEIFLVAAPKNVVNRYVEIMEMAGLDLIALETETVATTRTISFPKPLKEMALVLDFGSNSTDMSVIKRDKPIFSQTIKTGSDALTKAISLDFGLDAQQAEQYKRTYGLDNTKAEGKIYKSLEPIMKVIMAEVSKTLNFFKSHFTTSIPKKIYIIGDGALLIGLPEYLSKGLGLPTERFNPFPLLETDKSMKKAITSISGTGYSVAIGLALKAE